MSPKGYIRLHVGVGLEEYIKKYYKASAFNACKRQLCSVTKGLPMRIHTFDKAVPV